MEKAARRQEAAAEAARTYEQAVHTVLDRNARISVMQAAYARNAMTADDLPAPLAVDGQQAEDLRAWCARADELLAQAERNLTRWIAETVIHRVFADAPPEAVRLDLTGTTRTRRDAAEPDSAGEPAEEDRRARLRTTLTRVLDRLAPDTVEDDRALVRLAAAEVVAAADAATADSRLTDVRIRVRQANERARERRDAAVHAARCLQLIAHHDDPGADRLRAALNDVVAGRLPLDDTLRATADRMAADAQAAAARRYVAHSIDQVLSGLGYQVDGGFETLTAESGEVYLTRGDWSEHAVKVRVDPEAGELRAAVVRTSPSDEAEERRRLDTERAEQWCAAFAAARDGLAEAGVRTDLQWVIPPGDQVPVESRRSTAPRQRTRRRERER
ncbi:hypothetical protein Aph01nite_17750 [Acrocarpospora phusangensis]|uniref:Response regulator receiver protein n=1 Tax=Acrocarpospora phusangensis TaxID=1070424 RepID=A0A919UPB3_9ACTN|nr:hypothetical protein Aph01nite_17750 [Acrocarpospora phusangensis]